MVRAGFGSPGGTLQSRATPPRSSPPRFGKQRKGGARLDLSTTSFGNDVEFRPHTPAGLWSAAALALGAQEMQRFGRFNTALAGFCFLGLSACCLVQGCSIYAKMNAEVLRPAGGGAGGGGGAATASAAPSGGGGGAAAASAAASGGGGGGAAASAARAADHLPPQLVFESLLWGAASFTLTVPFSAPCCSCREFLM